jgi:hypothetical protein
LKKNKKILCYKGGTSVTRKHTSSKCKEHTNYQSKETCAGKGNSGKIPPWVKVSSRRGKSATRVAYKACFKGSVESNMELALGQRRKYENLINKDTMRPIQCNFYDPKEGKLVSFFMFRESEKT